MGSNERRAREKEQTREKILAAARDLILRDGFEAVSLRKIAESIEYTAPAIYSHFPDKHHLLLDLCCQDYGALREAMRGAEAIADPVERLRHIGRAYVDFALEHPVQYRFMFMTTFPDSAPKPEDVPEGYPTPGDPDEDAYAFLQAAVAECIKAGAFQAAFRDVHVVTQICWAAAHGMVSLFITHGRDPWVDFRKPRESAFLLLDSSLDGMLKEPRGPKAMQASSRRPREAAKPSAPITEITPHVPSKLLKRAAVTKPVSRRASR